MKSNDTWKVTVHWKCRESQDIYVIASNESQAKMKAVSDACLRKNELYDHNKTKAVRVNFI